MKKIVSILIVIALAVTAMMSTVSAANEAGTVYSLHDYFSETDPAPYSFYTLTLATGETSPITLSSGTGAINQYDAKAWNAYRMTGSAAALVMTTDETVTDARFSKGKIWGEIPAAFTVAIIFTAPVAGEYSFEMGATRWWDNNTTAGGTAEQQPCDITVKYGDQTKTTKLGNGTLSGSATGTTALAAGETIVFYMDPLGNGAGDNFTLDKLEVTLVSVSTTPSTPSAPATSDGIVAVVALMAVAGTAVIVSKKRNC